jgi:predicted transcriptional regulator
MLQELNEMAQRIEKFSRAEHDLIKEVHPVVSDIKDRVDDVHGAVVSEGGSTKR